MNSAPPDTPRRNRKVAALLVALTAILIGGGVLLLRGARPEGEPEQVVIAHSKLPYTALAQIAQQRGFFRKEGLDAVPLVYSYGKLALDAVVTGKAEFATVAETPTMFAIMDGADLAIVATVQVSKKSHALVGRRDRGITAPADLAGKRIGATRGTSGDFYLYAFLLTNGVPVEQVEVVDRRPEQLAGALARGELDAVVTWAPFLMQAQKEAGNLGITLSDDEIYTMRFNLVCRSELVRQEPGKVRKMLRALLRAEEYARRAPGDAQRLVAAFCGMDPQTVAELWPANSFRVSLEEGLLLSLEDESRWAMQTGLTRRKTLPNYLDFVYVEGLRSVAPKAVGITK